jgi:hypothetical protein
MIRYQVTARPRAVNACHCGDCKRLAGAPFGVYLHVARKDFVPPTGALDVFRRRGGSGNQISISRCHGCGTRMWHEPDIAPDLVLVCAGTLDDSAWAIPTSHIFVKEVSPGSVALRDAWVIDEAAPRPQLWDWFDGVFGRS